MTLEGQQRERDEVTSVEPTALRPWMPVLMYHRIVPVLPEHDPFGNCISAATFERHLRWLARRGFVSTPLAALANSCDHDREGRRVALRRSVAITFDDGYQDNYLHAWPLLKRYGFTATIFLVSDAIGGDNSFDATYASERVPMLTVDQIRQLQAQQIEFGSHTCSHPASLTQLLDAQLHDELVRSRSQLESLLDAPVEHFSYPHSQLDARVEAAVERAGYRLACAGTGSRFAQFCIHRVEARAAQGAALEAQMRWRKSKWLGRTWLQRQPMAGGEAALLRRRRWRR